MWFRSKYRALAEQLAAELAEMRQAYQAEQAQRIAAESIAADRAQQIEKAYGLLAQANDSRDAAVADRLKSLDLVNTALLAQHGPERPPPDIKQWSKVPGRKSMATLRRQADDKLVHTLLHEQNRRNKAVTVPPVPSKEVN